MTPAAQAQRSCRTQAESRKARDNSFADEYPSSRCSLLSYHPRTRTDPSTFFGRCGWRVCLTDADEYRDWSPKTCSPIFSVHYLLLRHTRPTTLRSLSTTLHSPPCTALARTHALSPSSPSCPASLLLLLLVLSPVCTRPPAAPSRDAELCCLSACLLPAPATHRHWLPPPSCTFDVGRECSLPLPAAFRVISQT